MSIDTKRSPAGSSFSTDDCTILCPCCHGVLCDVAPKAGRKPSDWFSVLPDDALEAVAKHAGADLPALACVSHASRRIAGNSLWRQAYEASYDPEDLTCDLSCGDSLPATLWRACLIKDHPTA